MKKILTAFAVLLVLELLARIYLFNGIPDIYKPKGIDAAKLFLSGGSYVCEFRGQRYLFRKPENVFRIVALGGSSTHGVAGDEETWPYQLEKKLNQSAPTGKRYEVINLGQTGATSAQEYYYLVTQAFLDPDIVIVYDGYNDIIQSNAQSAYYLLHSMKVEQLLKKKVSAFSIKSALYRHSALVNRVDIYLYRLKNAINKHVFEKKLFGLGGQGRIRAFENVQWYAAHLELNPMLERMAKNAEDEKIDRVQFKVGDLEIEYDAKVVTGQKKDKDLFHEVYRYYLGQIGQFLAETKTKGLFIFQPYRLEKMQRLKGGLDAELLKGSSNFDVASDRHFVLQNTGRKEIMKEEAARYGVDFVDAQTAFDAFPDNEIYKDNIHNTANGIDVLSGYLQEILKQKKIA